MNGLSVREVRADYALSRERLARVLDVSARTVQRWEAANQLPADDRHRATLSELRSIVELGQTVYTPAGFQRFLRTPLPVLDHRTPIEMLERGETNRVLAVLAADYEGLGY